MKHVPSLDSVEFGDFINIRQSYNYVSDEYAIESLNDSIMQEEVEFVDSQHTSPAPFQLKSSDCYSSQFRIVRIDDRPTE